MSTEKNENEIRALTPVICPHCNETLVVEFSIAANLMDQESTKEILTKIEGQVKHEEA
jgi:hypothetical protein